jgi:hypothetical protein
LAHPSRGNSREGRPVTARKRTLALSRSLSARARSRIAELDQEIDEAIVVATGAPREPECPAWVVLGVKVVEARGALHGEMHSGGTTSPRDAQADVALYAIAPQSVRPRWPSRRG